MDYYTKHVVELIMQNHYFSKEDATKLFKDSNTYKKLENEEIEMNDLPYQIVYKMWVDEKGFL